MSLPKPSSRPMSSAHPGSSSPDWPNLSDELTLHTDASSDPNEVSANDRYVFEDTLLGKYVSRYVLLRPLGSGGMGSVYEAYDPDLDRRIAIKLLLARQQNASEQSQATTQANASLLTEAQSLAQVSHPNTVTVFDVGISDDSVFLAMEYVRGSTLNQWIQQAQPSWRSILKHCIAIGHGLSASHRAGVIHGDVKPANIIIASDGQAKLLDFGLASQRKKLTSNPSNQKKVLTGIRGTPSFMSPEQHRGEVAEIRSDVFSLCVTIFVSIYGVLPFCGESLESIGDAKQNGQLQSTPRNSKVPQRIYRVLQKGLSAIPSERHPTIDALISELSYDPWHQTRKVMAVLATAIALAIPTQYVFDNSVDHVRACEKGISAWSKIWNKNTIALYREAFLATQVDFAVDTWINSKKILDQRGKDWAQLYRETCQIWNDSHPSANSDFETQMNCLRTRLEETKSLLGAFETADRSLVSKAVAATKNLSPISECEDLEQLALSTPLPKDLLLRSQVNDLRSQLAQARILSETGKLLEAQAEHERLMLAAQNVGFPAVQAEIGAQYAGLISTMRGDLQQSKAALEHALLLAISSGHDSVAYFVSSKLLFVQGYQMNDVGNAEELLRNSKAHLDRVGNSGVVRSGWILDAGPVLAIAGRLDEAEQLFREGVEINTRELGPNSLQTAQSIQNLAVCLDHLQRLDEAKEIYEKSLRIEQQLLGPTHPRHFLTYYNLAIINRKRGNYRLELQKLEQAIDVHRRSLGPEHSASLIAYNNLSRVYYKLGRNRDALERTRSNYKIMIQIREPDDPALQGYFAQMARIQLDLGLFEEAQQSLHQALQLAKGSTSEAENADQIIYSPIDVTNLTTAIVAAEFALQRDDAKLARDYLLHAQTMLKRSSLKYQMSSELLNYGWSRWYLHEKHFDQAIDLLQQSLQSKIQQFHPNSIGLAQAYLQLAQGLSIAKRFDKAREANVHAMNILQSSSDSPSPIPTSLQAFAWDIQGDIEYGEGKIDHAILAWKRAEKQFDAKNFDPRRLEKITQKIARLVPTSAQHSGPAIQHDL